MKLLVFFLVHHGCDFQPFLALATGSPKLARIDPSSNDASAEHSNFVSHGVCLMGFVQQCCHMGYD